MLVLGDSGNSTIYYDDCFCKLHFWWRCVFGKPLFEINTTSLILKTSFIERANMHY